MLWFYLLSAKGESLFFLNLLVVISCWRVLSPLAADPPGQGSYSFPWHNCSVVHLLGWWDDDMDMVWCV